jgi:hypothetical protein
VIGLFGISEIPLSMEGLSFTGKSANQSKVVLRRGRSCPAIGWRSGLPHQLLDGRTPGSASPHRS